MQWWIESDSHREQQSALSEALTEEYSGHAARHVWFNQAPASQLGSAAGELRHAAATSHAIIASCGCVQKVLFATCGRTSVAKNVGKGWKAAIYYFNSQSLLFYFVESERLCLLLTFEPGEHTHTHTHTHTLGHAYTHEGDLVFGGLQHDDEG